MLQNSYSPDVLASMLVVLSNQQRMTERALRDQIAALQANVNQLSRDVAALKHPT